MATDDDGEFDARRLLGGRYRVRAWLGDELTLPEARTFFLEHDEERELSLEVVEVPRREEISVRGHHRPRQSRRRRGRHRPLPPRASGDRARRRGLEEEEALVDREVELLEIDGWSVRGARTRTSDTDGAVTFAATCEEKGVHEAVLTFDDVNAPPSRLPPCQPSDDKPEPVDVPVGETVEVPVAGPLPPGTVHGRQRRRAARPTSYGRTASGPVSAPSTPAAGSSSGPRPAISGPPTTPAPAPTSGPHEAAVAPRAARRRRRVAPPPLAAGGPGRRPDLGGAARGCPPAAAAAGGVAFWLLLYGQLPGTVPEENERVLSEPSRALRRRGEPHRRVPGVRPHRPRHPRGRAPSREGRRHLRRGPELLGARRPRCRRPRPRRARELRGGRGRPGRLDDHPAVREGQIPHRRAHARAQAHRGHPRHPTRARDGQGGDPLQLPGHHVLRWRRVRHRRGERDLLPQTRVGAERLGGRAAGVDHTGTVPVRAAQQSRRGGGATQDRAPRPCTRRAISPTRSSRSISRPSSSWRASASPTGRPPTTSRRPRWRSASIPTSRTTCGSTSPRSTARTWCSAAACASRPPSTRTSRRRPRPRSPRPSRAPSRRSRCRWCRSSPRRGS
ncbi:MAG: hypothetical protein U5R31_06445 [Acidimicrobiia bacterium]|nr:hypothetical protein [Acidimicrobiia bacterium]